jgi:hypothetical protein
MPFSVLDKKKTWKCHVLCKEKFDEKCSYGQKYAKRFVLDGSSKWDIKVSGHLATSS